ncbi:MAG: hypothetical protein GX444_19920 [Myxococcales bacterium]|nr:hypothetical protein [Myxococcales bacterium]
MNQRIYALLFAALLAVALCLSASCGDDDDNDDDGAPADDDSAAPDDDNDDNDQSPADDDDTTWTPVEPHREDVGRFTIVWLAGTPYEMGQQQGTLLHEELAAGIDWLNTYHLIDLLIPLARLLGLIDLAVDNSYPDVLQECQGLVDTAGDVGWTMEVCLLLNFGDVLVEFLSNGFPPAKALAPGCTQAIAADAATADGGIYHARSLDWDKIDYLLDYPVIHVRQPDGGVPHVYIGFPGNLSPYSGMNAAGISIASDEADPLDNTQHDRVGRSHVQMLGQLLKNSHDFDEVRQTVLDSDHMTVEIFGVASGQEHRAGIFEMTAQHIGIRELSDAVVWGTNHFVAPETRDYDAEPPSSSSTLRFDRVQQLVAPDGADTMWGQLDPAAMVSLLRDRVNPYTGEESSVDEFDNNESIATNGAIYQIVFDPERLCFWVATGAIPVPQQPFVGFSLGELLELPDAEACEPAQFE